MSNQNNNQKTKEELKKQHQQEQAEQQKKQDEVLSGIIDDERRTYTFKKVYNIYGKELQGTFEAKYLSITDRLRIGVLRAKMLDGAPAVSLDRIADDIAYMIAYLTVALTKAPKWWDYEQMSIEEDISKLREVYREVYTFNQSFRYNDGAGSNAGTGTDTTGEEAVESM